MTMSKGETARLEIEPEWAYGRKGLPDSKYPYLWCFVLHMIVTLVQGSETLLGRSPADFRCFPAPTYPFQINASLAVVRFHTSFSLILAPPEFHPTQS